MEKQNHSAEHHLLVRQIRKSTKALIPTWVDLSWDILYLYQKNDRNGIREIYDALLDFELRGSGKPRPLCQALAGENLDVCCLMAELQLNGGDVVESILQAGASYAPDETGPVRKFYREATGYNPLAPKLS